MCRDALAELLSFTADGCQFIVTLAGYFDESDRTDGSMPICVAGYIFTAGSYGRLARGWRKLVRDFGLSHFHMTDLYAGQDECKRLRDDQRVEILERAVRLINAHHFVGIAVLFSKSEFEQMAPPWFASLQGSIYSAACQLCLRSTQHWLSERGTVQLVAYAFESGHKFQAEANAVIERVAKVADATEKYRYHSHAFVDKRKAAGLQAADLLAWTLARAKVGFPRNRTMSLFKPALLELSEGGRGGTRKSGVNVFEGEILRRFFAEQEHRPGDYYFRKPPEMRGKLR